MPSPSKAKGNTFERYVADFLTRLYGERFMRAPGLGAYIGGKSWSTDTPEPMCQQTCGRSQAGTSFQQQWRQEIQLC